MQIGDGLIRLKKPINDPEANRVFIEQHGDGAAAGSAGTVSKWWWPPPPIYPIRPGSYPKSELP